MITSGLLQHGLARRCKNHNPATTDCDECCCPTGWRTQQIWPCHASSTGCAPLATDTTTNFLQDCSFCLWLCSGTCPSYFRSVCTPLTKVSGRVGLCSAHRGDLYVPTTRSEFGKRSFPVAAPRNWNSLPPHLCSFTISREQFRARLKTHLFKCTYTWLTSENYWGV